MRPQRQEPSRSMQNIPRDMPSLSYNSFRSYAHHLTEATHGTEPPPLQGLPLSYPSSTSPFFNVPDVRLLQDRTSRPLRPYTLLPCLSRSSPSLSETRSRDHSYRRYQCECSSNSNTHQTSSGPNDTGFPSQASEAISSIIQFDRTSSAGIYKPAHTLHIHF